MVTEKIFLCKSVNKDFPDGLEFIELDKEEIELLKYDLKLQQHTEYLKKRKELRKNLLKKIEEVNK